MYINNSTGAASPVNIGTGTTTGTITIGGGAANQAVTIRSGGTGELRLNHNTGTASPVNIATGTSTGNVVIGNTTGTVTAYNLRIGGAAGSYEYIARNVTDGALGIYGGTSEATGAYFKITGSTYGSSPGRGSAEFVVRNYTGGTASRFALWGYDGASTWAPIFRVDGATGNTWLAPTDEYSTGKVGVGLATTTTPSATLHLKAGTASAGSAPLKFTSGANLTTPENGAVEYDGTNYYATSGGTRYTLTKTLTATAALNFGTTSSGSSSDLPITVQGAVDGDAVVLGVPDGSVIAAGTVFTAWVSGANTVTVRFSNFSGVDRNPLSGTFRVSVLKY